MTKQKSIIPRAELKAILKQDEDFLRSVVQQVVQEVLEAEMEETLGAAKSERTTGRTGYRSGYYSRLHPGRTGPDFLLDSERDSF